jgi:glucose-6-phosphate-specific signal transduction histidine kinase
LRQVVCLTGAFLVVPFLAVVTPFLAVESEALRVEDAVVAAVVLLAGTTLLFMLVFFRAGEVADVVAAPAVPASITIAAAAA